MTDDANCIRGLENLPQALRGGVLTIGNFDGVHLGHQRILQAARSLGQAAGCPVLAMTLEPPPDLVVRPADRPQRLTPLPQKCRRLLEHGAGWVVVARADAALLDLAAEEFIDRILVRRLAPVHVVEGPDFFFGRGRTGTVEVLRATGAARGFGVHLVDTVSVDLPEGPQRISSTLVRRLVAQGRVADAARCLGRPFALYGLVVPGQGNGRILDFPTANLDPGPQVTPADGVYAGWAELASPRTTGLGLSAAEGPGLSTAEGPGRPEAAARRLPAAISIGTKPTLGPSPRTVEAFLLGGEGDHYGRFLTLSFLRRLRGQQRFDGIEALRAQIAKDVQRVREICG